MICKFCGKEYEPSDEWKSNKFCSKSCKAKYSNIGKKLKAKVYANELRKKLSHNPKITPRELGGSYGTAVDLVSRCNPLRPFTYKQFNDDIKKSIVRRYVNNKDIINSLIYLSNKYNSTGLMYHFLLYIVKNFPHISKKLSELYNSMSTWDISYLFNLDQGSIRRIYGKEGLNVTSRSMKCSKIHLQTKPIIEEILGVKTETEHYISGYWIDEFSEELKLCIEIDGEWCHNKDYDNDRDRKLLSLGYTTVRIPAYSSREFIEEKLKPFQKPLKP